jgi:hypothetical protein
MSDFVGELLDSRSLADLASRLYHIGDALRAKFLSQRLNLSPSNTAVMFFFARCFKTYQAAIELLRLGFPQDAAALARVMREAQYQAAWIVKNGDETAKLFLQDYSRNRRKAMRTVAEHGDQRFRRKRRRSWRQPPPMRCSTNGGETGGERNTTSLGWLNRSGTRKLIGLNMRSFQRSSTPHRHYSTSTFTRQKTQGPSLKQGQEFRRKTGIWP